jgi:hypothetical protein
MVKETGRGRGGSALREKVRRELIASMGEQKVF